MFQVMAFGDSLTWGAIPGGKGRHMFEDRWTSVLMQQLPQLRMVTEGLSGRTTVFDDCGTGAERNGMKTLPTLLGSYYPFDLVMIMLGANDLKPDVCGYAQGAAAGVERLVKITREFFYGDNVQPPEILIMSPPHFCNSHEGGPKGGRSIAESMKLSGAYQAVAHKNKCHFFDAASYAQASIDDGVHLDAQNSRQIGVHVAQIVARILKVS